MYRDRPKPKPGREMGVTQFVLAILLFALVVGFWVCLWVPMSLGF